MIKIIGIAGGSGSGKTTFAQKLKNALGSNCEIILQDSYYLDQSEKFDKDGGAVNFDHPDALEFTLLAKHLISLKNGKSVEVPEYDFSNHTRTNKTTSFKPVKIILVDGILLYSQKKVIDCLDYKFFVDCPEDIRYSRRLKRDMSERGRTEEGVKAQFQAQVKPMHDLFVEPSKRYADNIITIDNFDRSCDHWITYFKNKYD